MEEKIKLVSPWVNFYREIQALFKDDPDVKVVYNEDDNKVNLYVEKTDKADALSQILPTEKEFGNVVLKIEVIPANKIKINSTLDLFNIAFKDNPAFSYSQRVDGIFSNSLDYVVFKNKVVQYFNDDLGDINGIKSTLYQDIAKDVFDDTTIHFCTDIKEPIYKRGLNTVKGYFKNFKTLLTKNK